MSDHPFTEDEHLNSLLYKLLNGKKLYVIHHEHVADPKKPLNAIRYGSVIGGNVVFVSTNSVIHDEVEHKSTEWPSGCIKPNSCARNRSCIYATNKDACHHFGEDITAAIDAAESARPD